MNASWSENLKPDPKPCKDGRCARKGCSKQVSIKRNPAVSASYAFLVDDPFCSTECAKLYHGVLMPGKKEYAPSE